MIDVDVTGYSAFNNGKGLVKGTFNSILRSDLAGEICLNCKGSFTLLGPLQPLVYQQCSLHVIHRRTTLYELRLVGKERSQEPVGVNGFS